jgi:hypothetical protein
MDGNSRRRALDTCRAAQFVIYVHDTGDKCRQLTLFESMTSDFTNDTQHIELRAMIRRALEDPSAEYATVKSKITSLMTILREEAASAIHRPLNQAAAILPQSTYHEKKVLANWVNSEMRGMGLALRCPKSGEPSIIQATVGHNPEAGKFRLDYVDIDGRHRNQTVSVRLPVLDPMPDTTTHVPHRSRSGRNR